MIEIAFIADHLEVIPTLAEWSLASAPDYYGGRSMEDIGQDFHREANRKGMPVRLVAFVEGEFAGTATFREHALHDYQEYTPALGGLYVAEQYRGQGVATALIQSVMDIAKEQKYPHIYAGTMKAKGILERLGWKWIRTVIHDEHEEVLIYQFEITNQ